MSTSSASSTLSYNKKRCIWHLLQHLGEEPHCQLKQLAQIKPLYVSKPCTVSLYVLLQSGQEHKVTQFQMSCWTAEGLCTSPPAIMAVIEHVLVIQRRTGNKPIVVHDRWVSWLEPTCSMFHHCFGCRSIKPNNTVGIWNAKYEAISQKVQKGYMLKPSI